ncbi:4-hydroxybenzoate octaprenyltransferase [Alphaproteobacteria bacterium SO-S41]|nr:4-hydroxybenzoate octaprenyltransferase [Alphaproteobacteria bacterium SO-S41]
MATNNKPADAKRLSWVERTPRSVQPYLRLMRFDRPIGFWLLFWPCAFGLALGSVGETYNWRIVLWYGALFAIGAIAMRGAGCVWNDIADRDIDAKVARTRGRPLPSGAISVRAAIVFLVVLGLIGLAVLLQFNRFSILLGLASLVPVAIYPFMKRITHWPQLVLGIAFNWGALMGWAVLKGELSMAPYLLFCGCVLWTIGYDTIYAHQDKEDDAVVGVKSTALLLGGASKPALFMLYAGAIACWVIACLQVRAHHVAYLGLALLAFQFIGQIVRVKLDNPQSCLTVFRSNRDAGLILFLSLAFGAMLERGVMDQFSF